ncbi:MAG: hypothetical protein RL095_3431 [Verrucomicrobiota bacterium]
MTSPDKFDEWICRIRSSNAGIYEDAYWSDRPQGPDVVPRLIAELGEAPDGYTRGKLLELLGEMGDPSVIPILAQELDHMDTQVRQWAICALTQLALPESLTLVQAYKKAHPDEV